MKSAGAYKRGKNIFLYTLCKTTNGVYIGCGPIVTIGANDLRGSGKSLLEVLEKSKEGVAHPTQWAGFDEPLLRAAGVKSWPTFSRSAKHVDIQWAGNRIQFVPTRNAGPRGGFLFLADKRLDSAPVEAELGEALVAAFAACE
jgi:hypothetical protein